MLVPCGMGSRRGGYEQALRRQKRESREAPEPPRVRHAQVDGARGSTVFKKIGYGVILRAIPYVTAIPLLQGRR